MNDSILQKCANSHVPKYITEGTTFLFAAYSLLLLFLFTERELNILTHLIPSPATKSTESSTKTSSLLFSLTLTALVIYLLLELKQLVTCIFKTPVSEEGKVLQLGAVKPKQLLWPIGTERDNPMSQSNSKEIMV